MQEEQKRRSDPHDHHDKLPKDILNAAQDPDSFRDPLEVQLEKSKDLNAPAEARKLEELKKKNNDRGNEPPQRP